jgi:hypothetical protein
MGAQSRTSRVQTLGDVVDLVTKALAALVALGSVVYLLGAIVLAGRLTAYSLPSEIVVNQLPQSFLVAIGLTEVVAPLIGVGALYLLTLFLIWDVLRTYRRLPPKAVVIRDIGMWALAGLLVLLVARLVWNAAGGWTISRAIIAAAVAAVGAAGTSIVLLRFPKTVEAWHADKASPLLRAAVVAVALLPLIAWNAITLPMPYAQVCPTKSIEKASGWLIGQTSDRLLLGSTESRSDRHVLLAPSANAPIFMTYQDLKTAPLPPCPSIPSGA